MGNKSNWLTIDAIDENPKSGGDRKPDSGAVTDDFVRLFHRNRQPESLEAKILFDADKLDATGAPYESLYREVNHGYAFPAGKCSEIGRRK